MTDKLVLAGFHAVSARLRHAADSIEELYVDARRRDARMRDLHARAQALGVRVLAVDTSRLRELAGEVPHQGVVAIASALQQALTLDEVLADVNQDTLAACAGRRD